MPVRVMHLTDTLEVGGMERVAVNLVNRLPRDLYDVFLCTTRREGALDPLIAADVERLRLARRRRFDVDAVKRLIDFIRQQEIQILHAHGSSLFMAVIASTFGRSTHVVWHCHFGRFDVSKPPVWLYRPATSRVSGIIAVNEPIAEWSRRALHVPPERVWYIPNFVESPKLVALPKDLAGNPRNRIICVANFRPQKDHACLVRAMARVIQKVPSAHLLLAGAYPDGDCAHSVRRLIADLGLSENVTILGTRNDVPALLAASDIAVLSSISEGLPLALLEYGSAGLPVVATSVGQCAEVLNHGRAGKLVPPGDSERLAEALISFLRSADERRIFGDRLRHHVERRYSAGAVINEVCSVYESVLRRN